VTARGGPEGPGRDDVLRIAALARIRLSGEEADRIAGEFAALLAHFASLRDVDTAGVDPLHHPVPVADVLRDDVPRPGLAREGALAAAPETSDGLFRVPRVRPAGDP
jgi:aspartyl-tRNA(Asn)/glutamyl-tRNA(Gln) amidotransferase subunit C